MMNDERNSSFKIQPYLKKRFGPAFCTGPKQSWTAELHKAAAFIRGNRTRESCLQQPTRTVRMVHGSPPIQAQPMDATVQAEWFCQAVAGLFGDDCRPSGGGRSRRWDSVLVFSPTSRRRAFSPGNAFPGTRFDSGEDTPNRRPDSPLNGATHPTY